DASGCIRSRDLRAALAALAGAAFSAAGERGQRGGEIFGLRVLAVVHVNAAGIGYLDVEFRYELNELQEAGAVRQDDKAVRRLVRDNLADDTAAASAL